MVERLKPPSVRALGHRFFEHPYHGASHSWLTDNGLYQLTVERIEFRGRYIETESLLLILIIT